jgi:hypothetical protein
MRSARPAADDGGGKSRIGAYDDGSYDDEGAIEYVEYATESEGLEFDRLVATSRELGVHLRGSEHAINIHPELAERLVNTVVSMYFKLINFRLKEWNGDIGDLYKADFEEHLDLNDTEIDELKRLLMEAFGYVPLPASSKAKDGTSLDAVDHGMDSIESAVEFFAQAGTQQTNQQRKPRHKPRIPRPA